MGFHLRGLEEAVKQIQSGKDDIADAAEKAVDRATQLIFDETKIRVPKKTSALLDSGRIERIRTTGYERTYTIKYGDSQVDGVGVSYAAAVHEILDAEHPAPTGPKYVELPLIEGEGEFKRILIDELRKAVKEVFK